jgi:ABC-type Fe3+-citrate transport system substrate-binding protein
VNLAKVVVLAITVIAIAMILAGCDSSQDQSTQQLRGVQEEVGGMAK